MLSYKNYTKLNESVRSEIFKNGMVVEYSKNGKNTEYYKYLCITEKDDIQKALDKLKWPSLFNTSNKQDILNDKYGILVTSRETGAEYVLISRILVNNILYIWDAKLKVEDFIKDDKIKSLDDSVNNKNLIYEKDVDLKRIITLLPDEPYYNSGFNHNDMSGVGNPDAVWTINHSANNLLSINVPNPINI